MFVYLISYNLHTPANNQEKVEQEIKLLGNWCEYLPATYFVKTSNNIDIVNNRILQHLESRDRLFVVEVKNPVRGRLSPDQWDWINKNL